MIRIFGNYSNKADIFIKIPTFGPYCNLSLAKHTRSDTRIRRQEVYIIRNCTLLELYIINLSHHEDDAGVDPDLGHRVAALEDDGAGHVRLHGVRYWPD